jgi:hypothetical protein
MAESVSTLNILVNGDFEASPASSGWTVEGAGGFDSGLGFAYQGLNNAWLGQVPGWAGVQRDVPIPAETCFRLTAKVQGAGTVGYLGYRFSNNTVIFEKNFIISPVYSEVSVDGYSDRLTSIRVFAGFIAFANGEYLRVDDMQVLTRSCDDPVAFDAANTPPAPTISLSGPKVVAKITGADSINRTSLNYGFLATDLGVMCKDPSSGGSAILFGDTFGALWAGNGGFGPDSDRTKNIFAFATKESLETGLQFSFLLQDSAQKVKAMVSDFPSSSEISVIPTGCFFDRNQIGVYMMSVTQWDPPGFPAGTWTVDRTGLFTSQDYGRNWNFQANAVWTTESNFKQVNPILIGEFFYLVATPEGRHNGGVYLGRVHRDFVKYKSSTAYWTGSTWSYDSTEAQSFLSGKVGEPSIAWHSCTGNFLLSYFEPDSTRVLVRLAKKPMGPWSEPSVLATSEDFLDWGIYGGFLVPDQNSLDIHWMMTSWKNYNVYQIKNQISAF